MRMERRKRIYVNKEIYERLRQFANEKGVTVNEYVDILLEKEIAKDC